MKTLVELAYEKKQTFINIVKSFGCNSSYAEDIVQELFIQIHLDVKKGLDLWYNDDINTYYCYKVLRGIYLNTHKKQARFLKTYIEDIEEIKQAEDLGLKHLDIIKIKTDGMRGLVFDNVVVRSREGKDELAVHLDTDEANAAGVKHGTKGWLVK